MQINKVMWILLSCVIYSLYGCNSSKDLPLSPLIWGDCDPAVYNISSSVIKYLGKRLTCTKMVAPMDYSDPSKGTILVALSRVSAENPSNHKGVIFFNPGGPGADGINRAPVSAARWSIENENDPVGSKFRQLSREYDLLSFSPRGVGSSTQLVCKLPGSFSPPTLPGFDYRVQNYYNDYFLQELEVKACRANPLTPYINTDATARDMDLARSLLGEQKISYIGYSYGTWLGVWYAALFPDRVDKMVLDSNVDITLSLPLGLTNTAPEAFQYILDNIITPYVAMNFGSFDSRASNLSNIFPALNNTMKLVTGELLIPTLYSQRDAVQTMVILLVAREVNQILENNPSATQQQIDTMIDSYPFSAIEAVNTGMATYAKEQSAIYFKLTRKLTEPIALSDTLSTRMAIMCNDTDSPTDFDFWETASDELTTSLINTVMNYNCTNKWGGPTVTRPDIANISKSPPILMVQTQFDGPTPLDGAMATYRAIGERANMVYVTKNYDHGVFDRIQNKCADEAVLDYLLSGKLPASRWLTCEGRGLLLESPLTPPGVTVASQTPAVSLAQVPVGVKEW